MGKRKRINYDTWGCRIPDKQILIDSDKLTTINNLLLEAVERLSGIAEFTRLSYDSQFDRMDEAVRIYDALIHLQEGVQNELYEKDYDFFTRLANGTDRDYQGPLETLSSIHMEDFSIPNEAGLTMQMVCYDTNNERCLGEVVGKETLTFEDFLCYSDSTDYEIAYNPVFEEMFREQYELAGLDEEYAYSVYMKELLESGEFDHEMQQPVLEFLSAGLDIVSFGLKPLIEAFLGEDLVTGDNLTDTDRFLSAVEGIIGLITFGNILSKVGVMGIEGVTAELAKEVLTDSVSNMTSEGLNELGVNGTVSTLAGVAVGGLTEQSLDDMLNVRLWGSRMEVAETPEEAFQFRFDDESRKIIEEVHEFDELDEWEEFYESMYDSQRDICVEYDDCLEDMRQVEYDDVLELRSREALQSVGEECGKTIESGTETSRPTWRQSELDAAKDFPDYDAQKSFINGEEVPYGTKGSVRPDYYKDGYSVDIKNYNVESASGRSNLARNIEKQYYQRIENLPEGTKQSVMIDIRGQNVTDADLSALYDDIMKRTDNGVEILFKMD